MGISKEKLEQLRLEKWNKTHKILNGIDHKFCNICNEFHPADEDNFYPNAKNGVDGLYPYCIDCAIAKATIFQNENHDKVVEYRKKNNKKPSRKAENKQYLKEYRDKGGQKEWQQKNREKVVGYNKNHREKEHIISKKEWKRCKEYFNNACAYCSMKESEHKYMFGQQLHKDHADANGSVYLDNCIPACLSCNSSKGENELIEWFKSTENFTEEKLNKIHKWLTDDYKLIFEGYREKRKRKSK